MMLTGSKSWSLDLIFAQMTDLGHTQQQLRSQVELTTHAVDTFGKEQQILAQKVDSTAQAVAQILGDHYTAHERDPGRPPSPVPPRQLFGEASSSRTAGRPHAESHGMHRHFLPKMPFPQFIGEQPKIWKDKCLDYFRIFDVPDHMWVAMASMNFDKNAAKWLQVYKAQFGLGTWDSFSKAVEDQFGYCDYREALTQLLELKQTGTMEEFVTEFESLQYQISMHNHGYDEEFFVSQFLKGLKHDISSAVQIQVPDKMTKAVMLAKIQQKILDRSKTKSQKPYTKGPSSSYRAETRQATPSSSLWKERQERDFRKANGLCFYCGDKFDASHIEKCTKRPKPQVNALVLNNLDTNLTDEVLAQLAVEDALNEESCQLSLHALAGTENTNCIKLRALVKNKVMLTLMDIGSSHSFVDSSFLEKVSITVVPTLPKKVKLANGQVVISDKVVPQLSWWCQGHTITSEMRVLDLGAYDAILGYDWLQPHSPMSCHREARTISFMHNGKSVTLQGVQPPEAQVTAVSSDTLLKWTKGNDIWAYALVDYVPADTAPAPPPAIQ